MKQHIATIAAQNQIKIENVCWAAAFYNERNHPHLHVVFWDQSQTIVKNFTHPEIPNRIRKQLIKDTFAYKIKQFCALRDEAKSGMTQVTDRIVDEFEAYLKRLNPKAFRAFEHRFEHEDEDSLLRFPKHHLVEPSSVKHLANQLFELRRHLPPTGRLAYKLLPLETKSYLDELVQELLRDNHYLAQLVSDNVQAKLELASLYTSNPEHLEKQRGSYQKEAEKRIANRILYTLRTILKLEKESAVAIRKADRQQALAEQLLLELLTVMESLSIRTRMDVDDKISMGGELSKQAKKEWLLRHIYRGMER